MRREGLPLRTAMAVLLLAVGFMSQRVSARETDWQPITPDELSMTSEPHAPGAAAIYLYRQVDRDDNDAQEFDYYRIKVLTEAGTSYGNVEIPFLKNAESVVYIEARTIRPDGTIVNFDGTIYEKTIIKTGKLKYLTKTFTLPDVQVGSIIEYRYRRHLDPRYVFNSNWILSEALFTRNARFSLVRFARLSMRYTWSRGLPEGTAPPTESNGRVRMEAHDIPAFVEEEYMPPPDVMKYRVDFVYVGDGNTGKDVEGFWRQYTKQRFHEINDFIDKKKAMVEAVTQTVLPADTPEEKLRKLYARVQGMHNLSFERQESSQEELSQKIKSVSNVDECWKRGYGSGEQLTWLFLALARAAGIEAEPVEVSTRDIYIFEPEQMNTAQLNTNIVRVMLNGQELFLDPGTAFAPFGLLPWQETTIRGRRINKDGGAWLSTSIPVPADSRVERKATLQLSQDGSLHGKLTVTFTGLEALQHRMVERGEDDAEHKRYLEEEVREWMPVGIDINLIHQPEWTSSSQPLVAEYDLNVPGWLVRAGSRALLPVSLFGAGEKHTFEHAARVHPLYFNFPFQESDDVLIELPARVQVATLPQAQARNIGGVSYKLSVERDDRTVHVRRQLTVGVTILPVKYYDLMRSFFQTVRAGDDAQAVLAATTQSSAR